MDNYTMELLRRGNKPEVLKAIVDRGHTLQYLEFLVTRGHEVPEIILNGIAKLATLGDISRLLPKIIDLSARMRLNGTELPENLIKLIIDKKMSVLYAIILLSADPELEVEQEIMNHILNENSLMEQFVKQVVATDINIPIQPKMFEAIKNNPPLCSLVAINYLRYGKKKYKDLDKNLIEGIASSPKVSERFAHLVQPYVDETPQEILSVIRDPKKIKAKWHSGTYEESFKKFFKNKN